jgi:hypothetical protein
MGGCRYVSNQSYLYNEWGRVGGQFRVPVTAQGILWTEDWGRGGGGHSTIGRC